MGGLTDWLALGEGLRLEPNNHRAGSRREITI
jgi:hypothetical protein